MQLVHTELDWTAGLRFGEAADVSVEVATVGRTSFALDFVVRQGDRDQRARLASSMSALRWTARASNPFLSCCAAALTNAGTA